MSKKVIMYQHVNREVQWDTTRAVELFLERYIRMTHEDKMYNVEAHLIEMRDVINRGLYRVRKVNAQAHTLKHKIYNKENKAKEVTNVGYTTNYMKYNNLMQPRGPRGRI
jgi:hypothetical protein